MTVDILTLNIVLIVCCVTICIALPYGGDNYVKILSSENSKDSEINSGNSNDDPVGDHVTYWLYTPRDKNAYQLTKYDSENLKMSTFNPNLETKVIVHGWENSFKTDMEVLIREAYMDSRELNILCVDWSDLASHIYPVAVSYTKPVGWDIALMIDFLVSVGGANVSSFHLIGHSLGAHVVSFAANALISGNISRITGLDPALPLFYEKPIEDRLDATDADVVDCIHTSGPLYGYWEPLGDYDFYPNKGVAIQPGCGLNIASTCSHKRAYKYYAASINYQFASKSCDTFDEVKKAQCSGNYTAQMGDPAPKFPPGMYYLETSAKYPYVKN